MPAADTAPILAKVGVGLTGETESAAATMHDALEPRARDGAGRRPEALPHHGEHGPEMPPQGRPNDGGCCISHSECACGTPWKEQALASLERRGVAWRGDHPVEKASMRPELKATLSAMLPTTRHTWPHEESVSLAAPLTRKLSRTFAHTSIVLTPKLRTVFILEPIKKVLCLQRVGRRTVASHTLSCVFLFFSKVNQSRAV